MAMLTNKLHIVPGGTRMSAGLRESPTRVIDHPVEVACAADWLPRLEKARAMRRLRRQLGRQEFRRVMRLVAARCG
jgi:hypothetical protein